MKFWAAAALVLSVATASAQAQEAAQKIDIRATPIRSFDQREPDRVRFGALEFRGGLELSSPDKDFGGLSAIHMQDGARFLTLSDKARWFRGRLIYRNGKLEGISDVETAPALGPDGRTLTARGWYDTESLAERDGVLYVGIERVHQILRFDYARDGLLARGVPIAVPPDLKKLPSNQGLECIAAPRKDMPLADALIAISERGLDADGNIKGFILGGATPGLFSVKRTDAFDIVDCAIAPDGTFFLLERRFNWRQGVAMRMRRIPLAQFKPGVLLDGPVVIEADMGYQIDNMEGLAIHRSPEGEIVMTLVSDDNFSMLQRTILLQFALIE